MTYMRTHLYDPLFLLVVFKRFVATEDNIAAVGFELNLYIHSQLLNQSAVRVSLQHLSQTQNPDQAVQDAANALQESLTQIALFLDQKGEAQGDFWSRLVFREESNTNCGMNRQIRC